MANFKNLTNKANTKVKELRNRAATIPTQGNNPKVNEKTVAKAVKSDATAKTGGGVFGSFIKQ